MEKETLTIMIPTLNRSDFVLRALTYYSSVGFSGYICIGDSSGPQHAAKTRRVIRSLRNRLRIIYHTCPRMPGAEQDPMGTPGEGDCMRQLIELAPTPYAVFAGDDDFQIPAGLEQCVAFLQANQDYSGAHGVRLDIRLRCRGAFGKVALAYYVRQPNLESDTASERWSRYFRYSISPMYSVHSVATWRKMYRDFPSVPMRYLGSELLPSSFSVILGKVKELPPLTTIHQDNDDRVWGWDTQSMYSLLLHPNWSRAVDGLRKSITPGIAQQDGIDIHLAEAVVRRELWRHIMLMLRGQYSRSYGHDSAGSANATSNRVKQLLGRLPGLVPLYRRLRQTVGRAGPDDPLEKLISLESLLSPSSPFHDDFMPIYGAIDNSDSEKIEAVERS